MRVLLALEWYDHRIHRGVATVARERGWHLTCSVGHPGVDPVPSGWRGDAAVCLLSDAHRWRRLRRACPLIVEIGLAPGQPDARLVVDNAAIGRLAAEHFRLRGFRSLACVSDRSGRMFHEREVAFATALADEHLVPVSLPLPSTGRDWSQRLLSLGRQLNRLPKPLGVFAVQDGIASEALLAALEVGLRVPQDVAVLGVDDVELVCSTLPVPLSSIDSDQEGLGRAAALRLIEPGPYEQRWPPRGVVERASTAVIGSADPVIIALLDLARRKPGLTITALAHIVGMSPQRLDRHCQSILGMSPGAILRRERLRLAGDALAGGATLAAAAHRAGLMGATGLSSLVRREMDTTPARWRQLLMSQAQGIS